MLTSAKTVYDPVKAYSRNERALLELQKIQQDVTLNFVLSWDPDPKVSDIRKSASAKIEQMLAHWMSDLKDQHDGLVLAAVGDIPLAVQQRVEPNRSPLDSPVPSKNSNTPGGQASVSPGSTQASEQTTAER